MSWRDLLEPHERIKRPLRSEPCGRHGMPSSRKDGRPRKRNQYPAACLFCGRTVAAGEGCIEREDGRWVVLCIAPPEPLRIELL